jgi:hypothetical protein
MYLSISFIMKVVTCVMKQAGWSGHLLNVSNLPRSGGILSSTTQASGLMRDLTKRATVLQGVRFTGSC